MNVTAAYTKTSVGNIIPQLNEVFSSVEAAEGEFSRTAAENFIILARDARDLRAIESVLDALAVAHPSRFFVAYIAESGNEISAAVAARCHGVSKSEHVCAEIVQLGIPTDSLPAFPSVVRSLLLTGRSTSCYVFNASVPEALLSSAGALCEHIIFDSGDFGSLRTQVATLNSFAAAPIDLRWVSLAAWRGQIKEIFSRKGVAEILGGLDRVSIVASALPDARVDPGSLLLAGWIVERLGLAVQSYSAAGYECRRRDGRQVTISLSRTATSTFSGLTSISFVSSGSVRELAATTGQHPKSMLTVARTSANLLEAELVSKGGNIHITRPYEDDSRDALIARFFRIGESVRNYPGACRTGALLERLQSEYTR